MMPMDLRPVPGYHAELLCYEVIEERLRQDAKFGEQHHPDGTGKGERDTVRANIARLQCEAAFAEGNGTWRHVLAEEYHEAMAESDTEKLRTELLQVAAVCLAWVQDIDGRPLPDDTADLPPAAAERVQARLEAVCRVPDCGCTGGQHP